MEKQDKPKINQITQMTKQRPVIRKKANDLEENPFRRRGSVSHSPPASLKKPGVEQKETISEKPERKNSESSIKGQKLQERKLYDDVFTSCESLQACGPNQFSEDEEENCGGSLEAPNEKEKELTLKEVQVERAKLEEFLFNENNKINKNAIKFILTKWMFLEGKLQTEIMEREKKKKDTYRNPGVTATHTYAQVASTSWSRALQSETEKKTNEKRQNQQIILVKPEKEEEDKRTNDEIKAHLLETINDIKHKIRIKGIRQMRKKGLIIEVDRKEDVELLKEANLGQNKLKVEEPRKTDPALIIFDVEMEYKEDEIRKDLIGKNLGYLNETEKKELEGQINFKHKFRTKENRANWIVQMPAKFLITLVNKGKIFMQWRTHRVSNYVNVVRCFKCQAYGHMAKSCSSANSHCETCGSTDHLKLECDKKDKPKCINCCRSKRKEMWHNVRSKDCPEYKKQVEIFNSRVKWL